MINILSRAENMIEMWRRWRLERQPGALGDFYCKGGNQNLWVGLPVESDDIVLDVGGFKGEWSIQVTHRYGCRSIIFEPVPDYFSGISQIFRRNRRVTLFNEGLAGKNAEVTLSIAGPGSSRHRIGGQPVVARVRDVAEIFDELQLQEVACMKINIEGDEFDLLDRMAERDLLKSVKCFLIQFHTISRDSSKRRQEIQSALSVTHTNIFDYPFVWERWDRH